MVRKKSGGRGGLYTHAHASMHAVVTDRLLSPIRPFVRRVSRTVGTFVRPFVMTVDETMTYFSGFHSQRGPRLFHSRFLAAPRPTVPRPWPREDPRTDARAFYLASGAISPGFLLLLHPRLSSLFHRCSISLLSLSLFPRLVKPFDGSSSLSFFRSNPFSAIRSFFVPSVIFHLGIMREKRVNTWIHEFSFSIEIPSIGEPLRLFTRERER